MEKENPGWGKLRVWDQKLHITIYKTDKQGPTVQHRQLYSVIIYNGKECEKEYMSLNYFVYT